MRTFVLDGLPVRPLPSPNHGPRRSPATVIVLHATIGAFDGAVAWLRNPGSQASAHFVVSKAGEIVQLVGLDRVAWHAGDSVYRGRRNVNAFSVGIEMENLGGADPWPEAQVRAVARLCRALRAVLGAETPIVGHAEISPGRKTDPKGFPWALFSGFVRGT